MTAGVRAVCFCLAIAASLSGHAAPPDRFALRPADANAQPKSLLGRFSQQAVATIIRADASQPRFALKTALVGCAPLADPLFANSFE